jgi:hypothetical protein
MQDYIMNQAKNNMNTALVQPVPLFASSWVALFCYLKDSLANSRLAAQSAAKGTKAHSDSSTTRH